MGGYFGVTSHRDAISDVFFGTDYHSHLGTRRAGIAAYDREIGLQRDIHNIQNAPFRTKFEHIFDEMKGNSAIGVISDFDPQPLLMRSRWGAFAIAFVGAINNAEELIHKYLADTQGHFSAMTVSPSISSEPQRFSFARSRIARIWGAYREIRSAASSAALPVMVLAVAYKIRSHRPLPTARRAG